MSANKLLPAIVLLVCLSVAACSGVVYLGKTEIPGTAEDLSNLTDLLEEGTPHNRLGGFGSALDYLRRDNLYVVCPDRGPADGATSYKCRLHIMEIRAAEKDGKWEIAAKLKSTIMLADPQGKPFTGSSKAFIDGSRLDPEGVRFSKNGTFFVSDEYGPYVLEFELSGVSTGRKINIPDKFLADVPGATPVEELKNNKKGRQPNRGMEGLALSPCGGFLYGIMQSPLIQDGALDSSGKRVGRNVRILKIDLSSGKTEEYVYVLENGSLGINELLALNEKDFLVIERDGKSGQNAKFKKILKADISKCTDVSGIERLPSEGLPDAVVPVEKSDFIDLLDEKFGLAGDSFPEKIEGLALGPHLPSGKRLLLVSSDNDFIPGNPSVIFAFAIDE